MSRRNSYKMAIITMAMSLSLPSCTNNEFIELTQVQATDIPIVFDTSYSRAEVNHVEELDHFSVWGWYQLTDQYINMFDNTTVTNKNGWQYEETRYWYENKLHHFYAIYPTSNISQAECNHLGQMKINNFDASGTNDAAIDLMLAQATGLTPSQDEIVSLVFQHILSRIHILARTDHTNTTITSIIIKGAKTHGNYLHNNWLTDNYPIDSYSSNDIHRIDSKEKILLRALAIPQVVPQLDVAVSYLRDNIRKNKMIRLYNVRWSTGYTYKYSLTLHNDDLQLKITTDDERHWQDGGDSDIEFN